jgi:glutamine amidotransferase-like uncharacterized protein
MKKDILVYTDDRTATGSLIPALQSAFPAPEFSIRTIKVQDIRSGVLNRDPLRTRRRMLVLPGIIGRVSRYGRDLRQPELQAIKDFVAGGNVLKAICGGAWYISRVGSFTLPGEPPRMLLCINPLFNGVSRGPHQAYLSPPDQPGPVIVPVLFRGLSGAWEETKACYDRGPLLYPADPHDPDLDVMAIYNEIADHPAAMLRSQLGQGAVYLASMHPEIYHWEGAPPLPPGPSQQLMTEMEPYGQKIWTSLTDRIKMDLES